MAKTTITLSQTQLLATDKQTKKKPLRTFWTHNKFFLQSGQFESTLKSSLSYVSLGEGNGEGV